MPQCTYDDGGELSDITEIDSQIDNQISSFDKEDEDCSKESEQNVNAEHGDFYNFKSCSIEEYEGRVIRDNIIPGKSEFWYWSESDKQDWELVFPATDYDTNPGNLAIKFSYTFDSPQTMTVQVENYIVTFFDLIGIVGGTLGMFISFAFYDNILVSVEYLIVIVNWVAQKRNASKVSDVNKSTSKKVTSKQEMPKQELPKQELSKQQPQEKEKEIVKVQQDKADKA